MYAVINQMGTEAQENDSRCGYDVCGLSLISGEQKEGKYKTTRQYYSTA
jgi:hypothetical protein